jgi:long-subunit fatty acid transport protein
MVYFILNFKTSIKMKLSIISFFLFLAITARSQDHGSANYVDFTGAIGSNQGSASIDYFHLWRLGKSKKIEVGFGSRFTSYFGSSQYYSSAPASLAVDESNSDSLLLQSPQVNALNIAINIGYRISSKFGIGFNIDALGFSFGGRQNGFYINANLGQAASAKPTAFNALLVGNNDRGSLNSEFYVRYFINEKLAIKLAYQYLFTEYTTETEVQQLPEANDRFRNKASLLSLGVTKQF